VDTQSLTVANIFQLIIIIIFSFFDDAGVRTQALTFTRQAFYHQSHSAGPFLCWFFFEIGYCELLHGWLQNAVLLISAS
jgi:hypothetical protein